jgi:hypothetical protein
MRSAGTTQGGIQVTARPRTYHQLFPAHPAQVREARAFIATVLAGCPGADDTVLCLSELVTNAILHSNSSRPGGTFTIHAEIRDGDYSWIEVEDQGGTWQQRTCDDGRPHGLAIVAALASDWGIDGDPQTGWIVWARVDWPGSHRQPSPERP